MKIFVYISFILTLLLSCRKATENPPSNYECHLDFSDSSSKNINALKYQDLLNQMTQSGVVGVSMSVYKPANGMWLGTSGKADLHQQINFSPCHITRVGSTVKMLTATLVLKLQEEGKLNINDKISDYLSGDCIDRIKNAELATIRQLLQHSSGIYNYIQNLKFQTASLNNLIKEWKPDELLCYAYGQAAYFKPDEDVRYSNTNYILLGLLIEKIEGKPLYRVFDEKIIQPLGLKNTLFAGKNQVPNNIVRGYIDMYSNLDVIESTYYSGWDYYTADGGLISNPYDMSIFYQALMSGRVLKSNTLNTMLTWKKPLVLPTDFFPIDYGLGIFKIETPKGIAYMHSGDAIGYYANMLYFPKDSTTIIYAVNSNYGKIDPFVSTQAAMEKIINVTK